jgi:transmembrane sensor
MLKKMNITDDLLISYLIGETSVEETKNIDRWLQLNLANKRHFEQLQLIWETSNKINFSPLIDASTSLIRLKQKIAQKNNTELTTQVKRHSEKTKLYKIAAAILLTVIGTWLYSNFFNPNQIRFTTADFVKIDTLSDGSIITANRHTSLEYPKKFEENERYIRLTEGEAFFDIKPNYAKSLVIRAGSTTIKVLGTSFNVKHKNKQVEVIVETGAVLISKYGKSLRLKKGERVQITQENQPLIKDHNPDLLYTYYRSKKFIAENTPLRRIVEVLNEAYDSRIIIQNKRLENLPLNTTFNNESLDEILEIISHTFNVTIEKKENKIILK